MKRSVKRYILWDNDGVLVDTEFWYFTATQRALAELGKEGLVDAAQREPRVGHDLADVNVGMHALQHGTAWCEPDD